ncbi:pentatricopeptide repeat-containing protein At1g11630, mitochondrial-like [Pistacia vera]|uniref:pentatricopeptide repeat-containing protein At1g11630, mitochondrial-like n=1 Tax=Pistacia vera TaxID=55513 RepID=UPI001262DCEA|nr:pentatricopeptide repeat-containing protein At1g11630, mitochondrial-like [Pistacia vera]
MDRNSVKANTKTLVTWLDGLNREEKLEDIEKVLKLMEKYMIKSRIGVYNARIKRLLRLGKNVEEAKALYDEMLSRGRNPSSQTYRLLIHMFQEARNVEEATRLSNSMLKNQQNAYINR